MTHVSEAAARDCLAWWLALAPTLTWNWAKTYAESAPHWYVVLGRTEGLTEADFLRAGRVIRTFGEPGKFYSMTNLYLFTEDRRLKFWCMWGDPPADRDATLINLAKSEPRYGPRDDVDPVRVEQVRLKR